jgi:hypothetical protein
MSKIVRLIATADAPRTAPSLESGDSSAALNPKFANVRAAL